MKTADFLSVSRFRLLVCAAMSGLAVPLLAHPAGDVLPGDAAGPVTLMAPDKVRNAPFLPDTKNNPLFLAYEDMLGKLEEKHISLEVHSLAVFGEGFLLNSSASPATVRYILKYKLLGEKIAWTESEDKDDPAFNLTTPDSGSFRITFPAKDWLLCRANRPPAPADDPAEAKKTDSKEDSAAPAVSAASLLKSLPDDAVMAFVWPEPGATADYPLLGELKSVSFHVVRDEKEKRPVHADIVMPAKSPEAAIKIQKACRDRIDQVYNEAGKLGEIPPDLVKAFTVTREDDEVVIHIAIPDDMAKYFFTQFMAALQEEIRLFAVPDKLQ